jgi:polyferredoxin
MRYALTDLPLVKRVLRRRWPQWLLTVFTLVVFVLAILTGLFGTPVGSHNFGIVFVWIVWWGFLILLLVPFLGRLWCAICPIPAPGEWLQRRALVAPRPGGKLYTLGQKWPKFLRNIWAQNLGFLAVALFSAVILTDARATAMVLLFFIVLALATSLVYERRTFCRYLCPVGGFIGLYSQVAPIEMRVKDHDICLSHQEKTCYTGSDDGYGCPWLLFPANNTANTFCGLCTECLKTCPKDNIALFIREPAKELQQTRGHRLDEAYKGLIMLAAAFIYSTVLIGPWGYLKETARAVGTPAWFVYAGTFLLLTLAIVPGLFWLCVHLGAWLNRRISGSAAEVAGQPPAKPVSLFADYARLLVPLGLAGWMVFTLSFVLINFSYAWPALSDPFGWGWNLFGTAGLNWTPYLSGLVPYLQIPVLLAGLAFTIALALRTARQHGQTPWGALPVSIFCAAAVFGLLTLYLA